MAQQPKAYIMSRMLLSSHEKLKDLAGKRGKPMTEILEEVLTKEVGETRQHGKRKDG